MPICLPINMQENGVLLPKHQFLNRDGFERSPQGTLEEFDDHIIVNGIKIEKVHYKTHSLYKYIKYVVYMCMLYVCIYALCMNYYMKFDPLVSFDLSFSIVLFLTLLIILFCI